MKGVDAGLACVVIAHGKPFRSIYLEIYIESY